MMDSVALHNEQFVQDVIVLVQEVYPELPDRVLHRRVSEVCQIVLIETHRDDLPRPLLYLVADMVEESVMADLLPDESKADDKVVKSIKEGDVTVQFEDTTTSVSRRNLDEVVKGYGKLIRKYRKLKW